MSTTEEKSNEKKFRKCKDIEFCQRHRQHQPSSVNQQQVNIETVKFTSTETSFQISNRPDAQITVQLFAYNGGRILQLRVIEEAPINTRKPAFRIPEGDVVLSHLLEKASFVENEKTAKSFNVSTKDGFGRVSINFQPFSLDFYRDEKSEEPFMRFNADCCLKFAESTSTTLKSPGADFTFANCQNLYGLPEHADSLRLKSTVASEPYRLYNVDYFGYQLDSRESLYGAVPFVMASTGGKNDEACGLFWLNPSETWVDVDYRVLSKKRHEAWTHFMSETGAVDVYIFMGPTARDVIAQYTNLVGRLPLPPLYALGYHQSRWNYNDQKDVLEINEALNHHDIPCDVIWLDIEHTDGKKYFTWDSEKFPKPLEMVDQLKASGRRLVNIVDPHMKLDKDYPQYQEASTKGYFIKDPTGEKDFQGNCWPGTSSWPDFTRPEVRQWWADQFSFDKYLNTNERVLVWNDMNEPSVFHGVELTMPKTAKHSNDVEHREVHNLYGHYQAMGTFDGLKKRSNNQLRPFVLTRSFFAGTQRYAAVWTGDNVADWAYLRATTPMLLSLSISGVPLCGADVGGFHLDPDEELLTRWFQAAAFHPFYREHSYQKRREPWLFSKATNARLQNAVKLRYTYLPFWYTLFYELQQNGLSPMRPLWLEYPNESKAFEKDSSFMVGDALFVHPVYQRKKRLTRYYLPGKGVLWYRADHWTKSPTRGGRNVFEFVKMDEIPVYQRGGSIIPRWMQPRRSSEAMHGDRLTLIACLDRQGKAEGRLFADHFDGYQYQSGDYAYCTFKFESNSITYRLLAGQPVTCKPLSIEKILIVGLKNNRSPVTVEIQRKKQDMKTQLAFTWKASGHCLEIVTDAQNKHDFPLTTDEFDILLNC